MPSTVSSSASPRYNRRSEQRARPSGGAQHARSTSVASASPSNFRGLRFFCSRRSIAASTPSSTDCLRIRSTVTVPTLRTDAMFASESPPPSRSSSARSKDMRPQPPLCSSLAPYDPGHCFPLLLRARHPERLPSCPFHDPPPTAWKAGFPRGPANENPARARLLLLVGKVILHAEPSAIRVQQRGQHKESIRSNEPDYSAPARFSATSGLHGHAERRPVAAPVARPCRRAG